MVEHDTWKVVFLHGDSFDSAKLVGQLCRKKIMSLLKLKTQILRKKMFLVQLWPCVNVLFSNCTLDKKLKFFSIL